MDDKEILLAKFKSAPRAVFLSILFLSAFVGLNAVRILLTYQQEGRPLARGFFYAAFIGMVFISQGLSLLNKSKLGHLTILIFGLVLTFACFALALHACRLLVTGEWVQYQFEMLISVVGLLQFVALIALEITLLRRDVCHWVWKNDTARVLAA